jgi:hypothetical protein
VTLEGAAYHPFYCEENVHHLCSDARIEGRRKLVAFVSNARRAVALWAQRAAPFVGQPVVWDYHVLLFAERGRAWEAYDLDSTLGCPVAAAAYLDGTFPAGAPPGLGPRFRVIDATEFVRVFASDRSHMRRPDGTFTEPPPPWPPIRGAPGAESNLERFVDVTRPFAGELLDLEELRARLGRR